MIQKQRRNATDKVERKKNSSFFFCYSIKLVCIRFFRLVFHFEFQLKIIEGRQRAFASVCFAHSIRSFCDSNQKCCSKRHRRPDKEWFLLSWDGIARNSLLWFLVKEENGVMEIISIRQFRLIGQMTTIFEQIGAFFSLLEREASFHLSSAKISIRSFSGRCCHTFWVVEL